MLRATKIRIYPNKEQEEHLNKQFGATRFVYNRALNIKTHYYKYHQKNLSIKKDIKPLLAIAKRSRKYSWLKEYDSVALQQSVLNLETAFKNFFNKKTRTRFPKYKNKHGHQSSQHSSSIKIIGDTIKIPKIDAINARIHRPIKGELRSITISKTPTGKYYASILQKIEETETALTDNSIIQENKIIGLDMGIKSFIATSHKEKTDNPRHLVKALKKLKRRQQALSKKKKGSKNRIKARLSVAKAHEKIANSRNDFQHKLSLRLIDENQAIVVETLKIKNMLKNKRLSKHIADSSWQSFITKLEYKAKRKGKHLIKLDQWYASSKTCSHCETKNETLTLKDRVWICPNCTSRHDRDINAAINIKREGVKKLKAAGHVVTACGDQIRLAYGQA